MRMRRVVQILLFGVGGLIGCMSDGTSETQGGVSAPLLDETPAVVADAVVTLTGKTSADAVVTVEGGMAPAEGQSDGDGKFEVEVTLAPEAVNHLVVTATRDGIQSPAVTIEIEVDTTAPGTPLIDPVVSPTRRATQVIRGLAEAGASIVIAGGEAPARGIADASGMFAIEVQLLTTSRRTRANDLTVTAIDAAGNASAAAPARIVFDADLPLDAPELRGVPSLTRLRTISIAGVTALFAHVRLRHPEGVLEIDADADGRFRLDIPLMPNTRNVMHVVAVDARTGQSSPPATIVVLQDELAPAVPRPDASSTTTGSADVRITGTGEPGARIAISGGAAAAGAAVDARGRFAANVTLRSEGENVLRLVAIDAAGNASAEAIVRVVLDLGRGAISLGAIPGVTGRATITIGGTAEGCDGITVTGGLRVAAAAIASDGRFSASVDLRLNTRNELHVICDGTDTDVPVVVIHDDRPPSPPVVDAPSCPTSERTLVIQGRAEAHARVRVDGGEAPVSVAVDASGRFSARVTLRAGTNNSLLIRVIDAAGNISAEVRLDCEHTEERPEPPAVDEPSPPPTSEPAHRVCGSTGPGLRIHAEGGYEVATGLADARGRFCLDVRLHVDARNEIAVFAVDGAVRSTATLVVVVQDSRAPGEPDGALIRLATGLLSTCPLRGPVDIEGMTGAVEPGALVRITHTGSGASVTSRADADGAFARVTMNACRGDLLSVIAADAAENASPALSITVD